jgi:hypothetical protein
VSTEAQITLPLPLAAHLCTEGARLFIYRGGEYNLDYTWMARFVVNDDAQTTFRAVGEDLQPTLEKLSALLARSRGQEPLDG